MKIAIPVKDESLTFVGNAGHTPKFAIYDMAGTGMFKSFKLNQVIDNPRSDLDHDHGDDDHQCSHDHNDAEHIAQHDKMGVALHECDYVVVKKACKNTANTMNANGISIVKYSGTSTKSDEVLREVSANFK
ncbi:hypothetical protein KKC13_12335 [bacterium]|nr:hypothetical protein [bacterium]MBU1958747.1 hypothetical protein [bacterium]